MIYNDREVHERRITATLSEAEVFAACLSLVLEKAGVAPGSDVVSRVFITNRNSGGISGPEYEAKVEITVMQDPPPECAT